jgi:hypothetical protein
MNRVPCLVRIIRVFARPRGKGAHGINQIVTCIRTSMPWQPFSQSPRSRRAHQYFSPYFPANRIGRST